MPGWWEQNLLTATIGFVEVPISDRRVQTGREWARHRFPYRDGQGGEDLGRKVYVWNLTIPLYRGIDPDLYPDRYHQLIALIEDPESRGECEFTDPEWGPFNVKLVDYSISTPADRRDGVELQITLEELGFDASALANLTRPKVAGAAEALSYAADVDQEVAFSGDDPVNIPPRTLTDSWRDFQASLDEGALAADVVAERMDELYLVADKYAQYSARDEIERWSIFTSTVALLGAAEDYADESARNENAQTRLIEVRIPSDMSAYDIASTYHGDAGRAEEVLFNNPNTNPASYPRGAMVRLNDDAKSPEQRQAASSGAPASAGVQQQAASSGARV
jgi:prophage DNA circulation protein